MKLKYLLTMDCDEEGYWDTSRYYNLYAKAYHERTEFDLDDEEGLIKGIACFIEEYPKGDYEIYVIQSHNNWNDDTLEWEQDDEHESKIANIMQEAISLAKKMIEEKRLKHTEEKKKQAEKERETIRQQELKKLEELKAKYETHEVNMPSG